MKSPSVMKEADHARVPEQIKQTPLRSWSCAGSLTGMGSGSILRPSMQQTFGVPIDTGEGKDDETMDIHEHSDDCITGFRRPFCSRFRTG